MTGSEGLVGRRLVAALAARGDVAVPFDIRRAGSAGVEDICDPDALAAALADADGVIHLAAISRVAWGEERPDICERVNVAGTATLLAAMASSQRKPWLVFASSREVYGDAPLLPVDEDAAVAPINAYGKSKAEGERLVTLARAQDGLRSAIVRLSSVYGTTDDHHDRVIPALLWRALQGETLRLTGADNRFDFVHVDDSVDGLLRAADLLAGGASTLPTVHLATGVGTSLGMLAEQAIATTGSASTIEFMPPRPFDVGGFVGSVDRARETLRWAAATALADGMAALAADMRARGAPLDTATIPDPDAIRASRA